MSVAPDISGPPPRPYVGLRAFRPDEHGLFFGRTSESLNIARMWRANKLTMLYGASGVGKTSLLQAGVIPSLDRDRFEVWPIAGPGPVRGLADRWTGTGSRSGRSLDRDRFEVWPIAGPGP